MAGRGWEGVSLIAGDRIFIGYSISDSERYVDIDWYRLGFEFQNLYNFVIVVGDTNSRIF